MTRSAAPTILIISQTISAPARRRTWQQARALCRAGWNVRAVGPRGKGQRPRETLEGIEIIRFAQPFEGSTPLGLLLEYVIAFIGILRALLVTRLAGHIDVVQVTNPPDWLMIPALLLRPFGTRVVYDQADLAPVLFQAKFGRRGWLYATLAALSGFSVRSADLVLTANDAYRRLAALQRSRRPGETLAVYSYPEQLPDFPGVRVPGPLRIGYFGVLGSHDGLETMVAAMALLNDPSLPPHELVLVGAGPALPALRRLAHELEIESRVRFLGFLEGREREAALASFDIAVIVDPVNRYTNMISMNKVFAYAAHGLPVVSTPLKGTRRLLGDAALFATNDAPESIAASLRRLLQEDKERLALAAAVRARAEAAFDWQVQAARYVGALSRLVARPEKGLSSPSSPPQLGFGT